MQDPETVSAISNATASLSDTIREIIRPWNIKREAKAEAYKMKLLAETKLYTTSIDSEIEKIKRNNVANILQKASGYIQCNSSVICNEQAEVDESWLLSFLDMAKNVSDEDMQELLAAILAGEYDCPGSFSIRTIQLLKNMSSIEAKQFTEIVQYCIEVDSKTLIVTKEGCSSIPFTVLMDLEDTGLINHNATGLSVKGTSNVIIKHGPWIAIISGFPNSELILGCTASLTHSGQELFDFMKRKSMIEFNNDFFCNYIRSFEEIENVQTNITEYNE